MGIFRRTGTAVRRDAGGADPVLPMPARPPAQPAHSPRPPFFGYFLQGEAPGTPSRPPEPEPSPARRGPALDPSAIHLRLPLRLRIALQLVMGTVAGGMLLVGGLFVHYTMLFPDPLSLRNKERAPVIRILARDGSVLAERRLAHDFMPLDLLPGHVTNAVVATEDRRFYTHWGVDPAGLLRAVFTNMRAGRFAQGGSTLTQQLAKNLFLTSERSFNRKAEELILALWLELRLSKHDILELYLNQVYFGGGAYGIEAAAQRYFDKSARELTLAESALIAGLLKAPSKYAPTSSTKAAEDRAHAVLRKMLAAGLISAEDERRAHLQRLVIAQNHSAREQAGAEYAIDFVLEKMPPLLAAGHAEVIVETTIDPVLQRRVQAIVESGIGRQGSNLGVSQAAVVVLDTDGGIRAMAGGRSYAESQFNRAVKARRQPGSAFKPVVYLAALESGMTPDTIAYDLPLSIDGWTPRNDSARYQGAVTLRQALSQSINTVAVRLLMDAGAKRVAETARRLGIHAELRSDPSLALGTSEMSLLELTGAYGVLGNGGAAIEPHAIRRVRLSSGRILFAREATRTREIVSPAHIGAMNDMLNATLVSGTGRRAAIPNHPAAGKTGTTQDFRDAWFIGYTAHLTAGVWVGNDAGQPMNRVVGGSLPATIWHDVMLAAHEGRAPLALPGTSPLLGSVPLPVPEVANAVGHGPAPGATELLPWRRPAVRSASAPAPRADRKPAAARSMPAQARTSAPAAPRAPAPPVTGTGLATTTRAASKPQFTSARTVPASVPGQARVHPAQSIDAGLIEAAAASIGSPDGARTGSRTVATGETAGGGLNGLDVQAVQDHPVSRIVVRPPTGLMTLGGMTR